MILRLDVCLLARTVNCAKPDEPIEMPFGMWAWSGPGNSVLDGARVPPPQRRDKLEAGISRATVNYYTRLRPFLQDSWVSRYQEGKTSLDINDARATRRIGNVRRVFDVLSIIPYRLGSSSGVACGYGYCSSLFLFAGSGCCSYMSLYDHMTCRQPIPCLCQSKLKFIINNKRQIHLTKSSPPTHLCFNSHF